MSEPEDNWSLIHSVGGVVIGRNEGMRLVRCLESILGELSVVYYVDSGSSDESVKRAKELGAHVIELDASKPFTAARARNEGWLSLTQNHPDVEYIYFVDGDCELVHGWIASAYETLRTNSDYAVVCGRRRERHPDASIYNKLCDIEWDTPVGETTACGGDAMMRVKALAGVDGFNASLVAGEEPELCVRMRDKGWRIYRIDMDMTLHDANITSFTQWWKRTMRAGHAFAQGASMHGNSTAQHWVKESRRILLWGGLVPLLSATAAPFTSGWSLVLLVGYLVSAYRAYRSVKARGRTWRESVLYGLFCTIGKFPEFFGMCRFYINRIRLKSTSLIEYKS